MPEVRTSTIIEERKFGVVFDAKGVNLVSSEFLRACAGDMSLCDQVRFERATTQRTDIPIRINELPKGVLNPVTAIMVSAKLVNSVKSSTAIRSSADVHGIVDRTMFDSFALLDVGNKTQNRTH